MCKPADGRGRHWSLFDICVQIVFKFEPFVLSKRVNFCAEVGRTTMPKCQINEDKQSGSTEKVR